MLLRSLSTVLAQDHFYSDFLSLLLTKQIHFESVRMIALAQHSLSVLTFVKLMIACVVYLLSRFVFQEQARRLRALQGQEHLPAGQVVGRWGGPPLCCEPDVTRHAPGDGGALAQRRVGRR